jgi:hypothetical protein
MSDNLEHICPDYRTVTRAISGGAPIYLTNTMWLEANTWWMGEEDIVCPVRFCPFCGLELKRLEQESDDHGR